jgi:hypothetical protein
VHKLHLRMNLRRPTAIEIAAQILLLLLLVMFAADYLSAIGATACGANPANANCYPWGPEGPAGDIWYYRDKETYLWTARTAILFGFLALVAPFFTPGWRSGLAAIIVVTSLGAILVGSAGGVP